MRIRMLLCLVAVLALTALSVQAYRLQFKDTAGATHTYAMVVNTKGTMNVMGMSMPMTSVTSMTTVEKVLAVKDNLASISYEAKEGKVTVTVSGVPGEDEPQTIEQPMPTFTITYDRTKLGKVSNLKMTGEMAGMLGGFDPTSNQYPGQGMEFPDKDLKAGDNWTAQQSVEVAPGSKINMIAKYTLTGTKVVDGKTYLALACDITADAPTLKVNQPADAEQPVISNLKLRGKATTLFDETAGVIFNTTYTMDVSMNLAAEGDAAAGAGSIKLTMEGKMELQK